MGSAGADFQIHFHKYLCYCRLGHKKEAEKTLKLLEKIRQRNSSSNEKEDQTFEKYSELVGTMEKLKISAKYPVKVPVKCANPKCENLENDSTDFKICSK